MGAHDALYEARQVGATIAQSTDNEVGALLSCPTQIDSPTFDQLKRSPFEVRRSKTLVGEISVGVRRLKTLVREISVGVRRLKVPALGLIANLTRLPCASATALGIVDPQVLLTTNYNRHNRLFSNSIHTNRSHYAADYMLLLHDWRRGQGRIFRIL